MRWRAHCFAGSDERPQLPEDGEDRHPQGLSHHCCSVMLELTVLTADREVHRRPSEGDARRDRQLLLREGEGTAS